MQTARFQAKVYMGLGKNYPGQWKYWAEAFSAVDAAYLLKLCGKRNDCFAKRHLQKIAFYQRKLRKDCKRW